MCDLPFLVEGPFMSRLSLILFLSLFSGSALASECMPVPAPEGAAKLYHKKCKGCHVIADAEGNVLAGKKTKSGPNLFGIVGSPAAARADYKRYGKSLKEARELGLVWDQAELVKYLTHPKNYLKAYLGHEKVRNKMNYKVKKLEESEMLAAFLASFGPCSGADQLQKTSEADNGDAAVPNGKPDEVGN